MPGGDWEALTAYAGKGRRLSDAELNGLIEEVGVTAGGGEVAGFQKACFTQAFCLEHGHLL